MEENKINIFMDWIYNKPLNKFSIKYWRYYFKFRKFVKYFRECNPDYVTLYHIVKFIRLLKVTYFYRFDRESELFSINDLPQDNTYIAGFTLYENKYLIEVRLLDEREIDIKVVDTLESKSKNVLTRIHYKEHMLKLNSISDEFQFDYINDIIANRVANILVYYYKHF